ncbi:endonuclease III domain-containing protein [Candidatus Woesearchaeota archaeon]|nr:endonuclease III domain-containing protein [Candidatus Woesearchaeota archaeon]
MIDIYENLLKKYGNRGWWPVTKKGLVPCYCGGPGSDKERFEVIVGAILTQNTSWKNVEKAIVNLNKQKLVDVDKILKIDVRKLAELIKPSGYFNQKAERLKIVARFFKNNKVPSREELLELKGVGPETADSILLYAFDKPVFVVDAYTRRIFSRLGFLEEGASYDEWQELFHSKLKRDVRVFQEYHALIVEHAKQFCKKKAECEGCFLKSNCERY